MSTPLHICLIGFSGSGKTCCGELLAVKLGYKFVDTDHEIERRHGTSISTLFTNLGEKRFRRYESDVIRKVLARRRRPAVIAVGGGAFMSRDNRKLIQASCFVIWLSCSAREIYRRLKSDTSRPLLSVRRGSGQSLNQARLNRVSQLLKKRMSTYRLADYRVATTGKSRRAVVTSLSEIIRTRHVTN